jgi:hypothetical protein
MTTKVREQCCWSSLADPNLEEFVLPYVFNVQDSLAIRGAKVPKKLKINSKTAKSPKSKITFALNGYIPLKLNVKS